MLLFAVRLRGKMAPRGAVVSLSDTSLLAKETLRNARLSGTSLSGILMLAEASLNSVSLGEALGLTGASLRSASNTGQVAHSEALAR